MISDHPTSERDTLAPRHSELEARHHGLHTEAPILAHLPKSPTAARISAGVVLAVIVVLALNVDQEWHWFGTVDVQVFNVFVVIAGVALMRAFGTSWFERVDEYEESEPTERPLGDTE